ncbi:pirin-like C-terminal cupin domain-containing protein [Hymenobacter sp. YC55]|uniref:pirin family protein n=1 Tax=Hymenobacter sp. YC55 TaxID=3034019 RepID=UPI0023F69994|nr:pirin-like C-terminal cupin domain-containing protein [Hymenobacter sp. YC55]MDF7813950.1 pirin-like C-terminal cupin domain-containing protein [Hymenobacter sp. YC55]
MALKRKVVRINTPAGHPGFMGPEHIARSVIGGNYAQSDPFIVLMDDRLDKKDTTPVGGPHPHAGFETVSLLLEGEMGDEAYRLKSGDFQMMTAGSGVVHTETIDKIARMRLLQLWVNLPKKDRWVTPRVQDLPLEHVPTLQQNDVEIKLYSGTLAGLTSPVENYVPIIIADIRIAAHVTTTLQLPANFNTLLYVLQGSAKVGQEESLLQVDRVGWLDLSTQDELSELQITAGEAGTRFVLYAGKPTGESMISHGPFIGDSADDINRLYYNYRQGRLKHIETLPCSQRILL